MLSERAYLHHVVGREVELEVVPEVLDEVRLGRELALQLVGHYRSFF